MCACMNEWLLNWKGINKTLLAAIKFEKGRSLFIRFNQKISTFMPSFHIQLSYFWSFLETAKSSPHINSNLLNTEEPSTKKELNNQDSSVPDILGLGIWSGRTGGGRKHWRRATFTKPEEDFFFMYNECNPLKMQNEETWITFPPSAQSKSDLETITTTMDTESDLSPGRFVGVCGERKKRGERHERETR